MADARVAIDLATFQNPAEVKTWKLNTGCVPGHGGCRITRQVPGAFLGTKKLRSQGRLGEPFITFEANCNTG